MAKAEKLFATETDLCAAFIKALPKEWTPYAETAGWDTLLVRNSDGFQIGIEAKLKFNALVLQQSLEEYGAWHADSAGPDCRAVLVPDGESSLKPLADYIGITVIRMRVPRGWSGPSFLPSLPSEGRHDKYSNDQWHEWCPTKRHKLPDYVPDVAAGASAPVQLTEWKIRALKLLILGETQGFVTRADFKFLGLDHRRWISDSGWLRLTNERGHYSIHGEPPMGLKLQHPRVYEEIKADAAKWLPPTLAIAPEGRVAVEEQGFSRLREKERITP